MATAVGIGNVEQHPEVARARAELAPISARREALERERTEAWRVGGRTNAYTHEPTVHASEEQITLARIRLPEIDGALRRLRLDEAPAERLLEQARQRARVEVLEQIDAERRKLVARLDAALDKAAAVNNELIVLDERAQAIGGNYVARAAWGELLPETPVLQSRVACWRSLMKQNGLL